MKIKRFDVTTAFLKDILSDRKHCFAATRNAIPEDAELVRIAVDQNRSSVDIISLFFASESFPDLPEGSLLKSEVIEITKYFGTEAFTNG